MAIMPSYHHKYVETLHYLFATGAGLYLLQSAFTQAVHKAINT
jgi:hypothetical protein